MAANTTSDKQTAAIAMDFKAAFPSVSQTHLLETLQFLGLPDNAIQLVKALYLNNKCQISVQGQLFPGCNMGSGVRQGCPLSPMLFTLLSELAMDIIESRALHTQPVAYADDTMLLIRDVEEDVPKLEKVFDQLAAISGMELNLDKCVILPCNNSISTLRNILTRRQSQWINMEISSRCKYLGFYVGRGKAELAWDKPLKKFQKRCKFWRTQKIGSFWKARLYNVMCISTLPFLPQLMQPPKEILQSVHNELLKYVGGPANSIDAPQLYALKENFYQTTRYISYKEWAQAAAMRTWITDQATQGGRGQQFKSRLVTSQQNDNWPLQANHWLSTLAPMWIP